jgi:DNA-binding CsgD family transcriptional regulator
MGDPVLVERDHELALLGDVINGVAGAASGFVVVEGAAGVGKTELLGSAARLGANCGARVLRARGSELEHQFTFGVVRQLFEPVLSTALAGERAEWVSGAAGPAGVLLGAAGSDQEVGVPGEFAVLNGLFWLAANLCAGRPLVLVVDDLHWADRASLRFLAFVQPRLQGLRLAVVAGTRPREPGAEQRLLDVLAADPSCQVVRPGALSTAGTATLLGRELGGGVEPEPGFVAACHAATGGNPLLLKVLARAVAAENVTPTAANAARVPRMGGRALRSRVGLWLGQLPPECAALARAVAVLGDEAAAGFVAAVAGLSPQAAATAAGTLQQVQILAEADPTTDTRAGTVMRFVHPLLRAAVYDQMDPAERAAGHATAARLLGEAGADVERVAAHLLRTPPAADQNVVTALRQAAAQASGGGIPETAVAYLERALEEPASDTDRPDLLVQLGLAAMLVNPSKSARYLTLALDLRDEPNRRAELAIALGNALVFAGRGASATTVYQRALDELGDEHEDLRRRVSAGLVVALVATDPVGDRGEAALNRLRDLPDEDGLGSRMLDGLIAFVDAFVLAAPEAVARARRCLGDGKVVEQANGSMALVAAWQVLAAADRPEATEVVETAAKRASQEGSLPALCVAKRLRSEACRWWGSLAEAEAEAREAQHLVNVAELEFFRPQAEAALAAALLEQGRLHEAQDALESAESIPLAYPDAQSYGLLNTRAGLLLAQGRADEGLPVIQKCGAQLTALRLVNPVYVPWRLTAALTLQALGRADEARQYAEEELELARRWGAPRALGRAARVAGLVRGSRDGLLLLRQAVDVLEPSPARLDYAKALVDLGAALRRSGQRTDARGYLTQGLEMAHHCGATPLVDYAGTELRAAGGRPRRPHITGPDALTPSETRVAHLAASGRTNREIAQQLYVTTKTVEVHLSAAYRKLGITRRTQLSKFQ